MLVTIWITCFCYLLITIFIHLALFTIFPHNFCQLPLQKQLRLDFRSMRIFAGLQCSACFLYAFIGRHNLTLTSANETTVFIFETYIGYTLFELLFMFVCCTRITDFVTKPALRLLFMHHIMVGSAAYALISTARTNGCSPHYLGLVTLGNEAVVISYAIIEVGTHLGYGDHKLIKFNTYSLPLQYSVRQLIFLHLTYSMFTYYSTFVKCCPDWFSFLALYGGMNALSLVLNPYWTYQTFEEFFKYVKKEKNKNKST